MKRETTNGLPEYKFKYTLDGKHYQTHHIGAASLTEAMSYLPPQAKQLQYKRHTSGYVTT